MNPLNLKGPEFLAFYFMLGIASILTVIVRRWMMEPAGPPKNRIVNPYLIAALRDGVGEVIRVAVISLIDRRKLIADGNEVHAVPKSAATEPIEQAVLQAARNPITPARVSTDPRVRAAAAVYETELSKSGLLPTAAQTHMRWVTAGTAAAILVGFAALKVAIAISRGRTNVEFLVLLAIGFSIATLVVANPRQTSRGRRALADLRELFGGLRARASKIEAGRAPQEMALLVGVFGLSAAAGTSHGALVERLYPAPVSSSTSGSTCGSGSSCSSGCGGGGGGCGGCGS